MLKTMTQKLFPVLVGVFVLFIFMSPVAAASISRGYVTSDKLRTGSIVSLVPGTDDQVQASTIDTEKAIAGVVVSDDNELLSLTSSQTNVQVASDNTVSVLVSDINGQVNKGDYVAITNLKGIGGKVTDSNELVIGIALENATDQNNVVGNLGVESKDGSTVDARVSLISMQIGVRANTFIREPSKAAVVTIGEAIVGRPVSLAQSIFSSLLLLVSFAASAVLLSASVRGSFVSLGRNPMAIRLIQTSLLKTSLLSGFVLALGVGLAYLVLLA